MHKLSRSVGLAILCAGIWSKSFGTGNWMPRTVLQDNAKQVLGTPEFFWELECKRIAQEFTPPEKRIASPPLPDVAAENADVLSREQFTSKVDNEEFAAAVKAGEVKPPNADEAIKQHAA